MFIITNFFSTFSICLFLCAGILTGGNQYQPGELDSRTYSLSHIAGHRITMVFTPINSPLGFFSSPSLTFQDKDGYYWVAEAPSQRILRYDSRSRTWVIFWDKTSPTPKGLNNKPGAIIPAFIGGIKQSSDGKVWFASKSSQKISLGREIVSYYDGELWGKPEGINESDRIYNIGLFTGRDGILWCWRGDELRTFNGKKWSDSLVLTEIFKTANRIEGATLNRKAAKDEQINIQKKDFEIIDALQDNEGYIWACTLKFIVRFKVRQNKVLEFSQIISDPVSRIFEDRTGRMWLADYTDVYIYDKRKKSKIYHDLSNHIPISQRSGAYIRSIYQDKQKNLLFGLNRGLLYYRESINQWEYFDLLNLDRDDLFDSVRVDHIMEDSSGKIWLSTSVGVVILEP
jgi:hypothetical protein